MAPPTENDVSHDQVRAELANTLQSKEFVHSERLKRFLQFVVEEHLAGRGARLKAYTVAIAVFDRGDDFNANIDPIVRIEAGRLRRALQHYYLTEGSASPVRIDVPRGGYRPVISEWPPQRAGEELPVVAAEPGVEQGDSTQSRSRGWRLAGIKPQATWIVACCAMLLLIAASALLDPGPNLRSKGSVETGAFFAKTDAPGRQPTIVLNPFRTSTGNAEVDFFARGITEELAQHLAGRASMKVHYASQATDGAASEAPSPDISVSGSVHKAGNVMLIFVYVTRTGEGLAVESKCFERDGLKPTDMIDVQSGAARCIAAYVEGMVAHDRTRP